MRLNTTRIVAGVAAAAAAAIVVGAACGSGHDDRDRLGREGHCGGSRGRHGGSDGEGDEPVHRLVYFNWFREHVVRKVQLPLQDLARCSHQGGALDAGVGA
jgi:hypothetical protein